MFTIGEFATIGRVSVRMLRHYDAVGLLPPAQVDEHTGYRHYSADQLRQLNRLLALKDLGFTLDQVGQILSEQIDAGQLRGMLRLRRTELSGQIDADRARLARVEARLRVIEKETSMSTSDTPAVVVKELPTVHLAQLSGVASSTENDDVGPVVQALYEELGRQLGEAGIMPTGPAVAHYQPTADGSGLTCYAGLTVAADVSGAGSASVVDLPGLDQAATLVHHGAMSGIGEVYQRLGVWIEDKGYRTDGTAREVSLVSFPEPQERWITEVVLPISST